MSTCSDHIACETSAEMSSKGLPIPTMIGVLAFSSTSSYGTL